MYEEFAPARKGAFRDGFLIVVAGFVLLSLPSWLGDEGLFENLLSLIYNF